MKTLKLISTLLLFFIILNSAEAAFSGDNRDDAEKPRRQQKRKTEERETRGNKRRPPAPSLSTERTLNPVIEEPEENSPSTNLTSQTGVFTTSHTDPLQQSPTTTRAVLPYVSSSSLLHETEQLQR